MTKYIDADCLRAEIENLIEKYSSVEAKGVLQEGYKGGRLLGYRDTINKLDSLQQEQQEVDLEEEIETYFKGWYMDETDQGYILHTPDDHAGLMSVKQIARHFYELGLNAKKEEQQ